MDMVPCPPMGARLTIGACRRMWAAAQERRPEVWEAKAHCRNCLLGAERSGATAERTQANALTDVVGLVCSSCERSAARLIHRVHCVSCYNRRREVACGRNRRGGRPQLTDALHAERVAIFDPASGAARVVEMWPVVSVAEVILRRARQAQGASILFGRPPAVPRHAA